MATYGVFLGLNCLGNAPYCEGGDSDGHASIQGGQCRITLCQE